jgi:hypothetical protein
VSVRARREAGSLLEQRPPRDSAWVEAGELGIFLRFQVFTLKTRIKAIYKESSRKAQSYAELTLPDNSLRQTVTQIKLRADPLINLPNNKVGLQ